MDVGSTRETLTHDPSVSEILVQALIVVYHLSTSSIFGSWHYFTF